MNGGVCVITGAGRGIGATVARRVAAARPDWSQVLTWHHDEASVAAVAADLAGIGVATTTVRADVAEEADVLAVFEAADRLGPVAALVNNAGIVGTISRLVDYDADRIARVMAVNVNGTILCAREAVRRMSTAHGGAGGVIVNVSSRAASFGSPNEYIDYAASKGAVDTFTIGLATEVGREGIRVNAVRPGLIETDIHASAGRPTRVADLAPNIPMGRGGTTDEVAAAVCWLLSDEATYVTGALLDVGGGR